jgi:hypothetical protein
MTHGKKTLTIAAAATGMLLAAGGVTAVAAPHAPASLIATPKLTVTASKGGLFHVVGPRHFSAGRVDLVLHAKKGEQEVLIARLRPGYTYADVGRDFGTFFSSQQPTPAGLEALNHLVRHVTFYGGLDSGGGHTTLSGSVVLPRAGTYLLLNDENGPGVAPPIKLHVTKRAGSRTTPASSATVKTRNSKRFAGATTLPASGTVTFHNTATNSPHFMFLQHVKPGTTRKHVIKALNSTSNSPQPSFALKGTLGTDVVSPGHEMTLSYSLPKGTYAEMCYFPDLQTGMPHALMGMVLIVHLK